MSCDAKRNIIFNLDQAIVVKENDIRDQITLLYTTEHSTLSVVKYVRVDSLSKDIQEQIKHAG